MITEVQQATHEAMSRVQRNADPLLVSLLFNTVKHVANTKEQLTTDDVWEAFNATTAKYCYGPYDKSIIGPVMMRAVKGGYIDKKYGATVNSRQPQSHGRLLRVFTSNVVGLNLQ